MILERNLRLCRSAVRVAAFLLIGAATAVQAQLPPEFVLKWGDYGSGDGQFNAPRGVEIGPDGNAYVVDGSNHRIQKFTSEGVYLDQWGGLGSGDGQLNDPWDITIDPQGFIYVAEYGNHRVQKFTLNGVFVTKWGTYGSGPGQFYHCNGVAVAPDGSIYVCDTWNHRVQHFSSDGTYLGEWGGQGSADGKLFWPHALAVDGAGFVFVADTQNYRIQKFTGSGSFLLKWGTRGSADGQFQRAEGITADADGNVWVSDNNLSRIQKFDGDGTWIFTWGSPGSADGEFNRPLAVDIDPSGYVYVPDASNHRIQKFGPPVVAISGTVASDCTGSLVGVTVDLLLDASNPLGDYLSTVTDPLGQYAFADVPRSALDSEISIVVPLGFEPVTPPDGQAPVILDSGVAVDFVLDCLTPVSVARSMGYWKHQASVYLKGKGSAQETEIDFTTTYPTMIFEHFYENALNDIVVSGVTYMDPGSGPTPLDLASISETLCLTGNAGMIAKAKQQYLAFLLNLASGKLQTFTIVSEDGATASQALQYAADLINDGDPTNDELAKDIGDAINNSQLLGVGVIPDSYTTISYASTSGTPAGASLIVFPNPGIPSKDYTLSFAMPLAGSARLDIYDVRGRRVTNVLAGEVPAGRQRVTWRGEALPRGVYFATLTSAQGVTTTKFVHLGR